MELIKVKNYEDMSRKAAEIIAGLVREKPDCVLGLATGSTPVGTYKELIKMYEAGEADFSKVKTANLDEYVGLSGEDKRSYRYFMNDMLFDHINIDKKNTFIPDGLNRDEKGECERYEKILKSLGDADLQILGLGLNGHIGFNEPSDHFPKATHCVRLERSTIDANKRFFSSEDEVPKEAYTMGIGTIMRSRKILLLVSGEGKADILSRVLSGKVTPAVPASILQFHPNVTVIADETALKLSEL